MAEIKSFRDLETWKMAMVLVERIYEVPAAFPQVERYGLTSQIRRAAVSVPSNVAEGQAVGTARWSLRHIRTAIGSLAEVETQLEVSFRLKFAAAATCQPLLSAIENTRRLLYGMRRERERRIGVAGAGLALFFFLLARSVS